MGKVSKERNSLFTYIWRIFPLHERDLLLYEGYIHHICIYHVYIHHIYARAMYTIGARTNYLPPSPPAATSSPATSSSPPPSSSSPSTALNNQWTSENNPFLTSSLSPTHNRQSRGSNCHYQYILFIIYSCFYSYIIHIFYICIFTVSSCVNGAACNSLSLSYISDLYFHFIFLCWRSNLKFTFTFTSLIFVFSLYLLVLTEQLEIHFNFHFHFHVFQICIFTLSSCVDGATWNSPSPSSGRTSWFEPWFFHSQHHHLQSPTFSEY